MVTLLVLGACLLVIGFLFGKRFGLPVLGFAAGSLISMYESTTLSAVAAPYIPQYVSYVPPVLIVLPAIILVLFGKGRHRKLIPRVVNAVIFAAAGLVFIMTASSTPGSLTGGFPIVTNNAGLIVSGVLALAILETIFGKASKKKIEEPHK